MDNNTIGFRRNGFIATLVINRPTRLNILTSKILEQLLTHCHTLKADSETRAVPLTSVSEKAFYVGAGIHRRTSLSVPDMWCNWVCRSYRAFDALAQLPQPIIALLHGLAYGGGLGLAAATDVRICSVETQMALPETGLATVPGRSGAQRLMALLGRSLVEELVFTDGPLDAQRALSRGLVSRAVTREASHDARLQLAQRITQRVPVAVQIAKQITDTGEGIAMVLMLEVLIGAFSAMTEDAYESSQVFTEKRQPHFGAR